MRLSSPWIISLSLRIYKQLLAIGPADFRQEYTEPAAQVFQQYCEDAYQYGGTRAVINTWLPVFSEAVTDMLAERFSQPVSSQESRSHMFYNTRRAMVTIFCAFVLFTTAYVCLQYIVGSSRFSHIHNELNITFIIIKYSTNIAFLALVFGGLPLLFTIMKRALTDKYNHPLLSFFITVGQILAFFPLIVRGIVSILGYSIVLSTISSAGFIRPSLEIILSFMFLADVMLLIIITVWIGNTSPEFNIPRRDFSATLLYLARIPMLITAIAMSVALAATLVWAIWLWALELQFSTSDTGIGGNSLLLIIVFAAMTFSCSAAVLAMRDNSSSHTPATHANTL